MTHRCTSHIFPDLLEMLYLLSAFERYQCTQDCPTFATQLPDLIFENLSFLVSVAAFPGILHSLLVVQT